MRHQDGNRGYGQRNREGEAPYWHQWTPPTMTSQPSSQNSDLVTEVLFDQTRALGRIEGKLEDLPSMKAQISSNTARIGRLEAQRMPKKGSALAALLKENWTWPVVVILLSIILRFTGNPQLADKLTSGVSQAQGSRD